MRRALSSSLFDLPSASETPLDWRTIVTAQLFAMCSIAGTTALFSTAFFMCRAFDASASARALAFRAGALTAMKPLCSAVSAVAWGKLGDAWGFERSIALTGAAHAMVTVGFALSGSTGWAFAFRAAQGVCDGMVVLQKPALALVSDATNAARAFATTGVAYGVASAFSPALAATLSEPCDAWNLSNARACASGSFLREHPFFLANVWISAMAIVPLVAWFLGCLEIDKHRERVDEGDGVVAEVELLSVGEAAAAKGEEIPWWRDVNVRAAIASQVGCTFVVLTGAEMTPVWMATSYENGGLGMKSVEIGAFGSVMGGAILAFQVFLFTRLTRKYGIVSLLTRALLVNAVAFPLHPLAHVAAKSSKAWTWFVIVVLGLVRGMSGPIIMGGSSLILNNSSPRNVLGAVNGFSGMFGNFARGIAPLLGGSLVAMMVAMGSNAPGREIWPFAMIGFGFVALTFLSRNLSPELNVPRGAKKARATGS